MLIYGLAGCLVLVVHTIFGLERVHLCVMGCFSIAVVLGPNCSRLGTVHTMLIRWSFFMDFTIASAFPLLWGYLGDEVTCSKPHCFANFWKTWDVNCGPWSVHTLSGAPVQQNDDLRDDTSFSVVVLVIIVWIRTPSFYSRFSCSHFYHNSIKFH